MRTSVALAILMMIGAGRMTLAAPVETEIGAFPKSVLEAFASPDGQHVVTVENDGEGKKSLLVDGKEATPPVVSAWSHFANEDRHQSFWKVNGIAPDAKRFPWMDHKEIADGVALQLSPDGQRFSYTTMKRERMFTLVIDGREVGVYSERPAFTFSADSKRYAFAARKGTEDLLVVDGKMAPGNWGLIHSPYFSPDSKHLAVFCHAKVGGGTPSNFIVRDGVPGKTYGLIVGPVFSPDSQHLAYLAISDKNYVLVVDGKEKPLKDKIPQVGPVFSPDSKSIVFHSNDNTIVETGGKDVTYKGIYIAPVFSPDSKRLAAVVKQETGNAVSVNGELQKVYPQIAVVSLTYSSDSKHLAYLVHDSRKRIVVVDGEEGTAYDRVVPMGENYIRFLPDGTAEYLAAKGGKLYRVQVAPK